MATSRGAVALVAALVLATVAGAVAAAAPGAGGDVATGDATLRDGQQRAFGVQPIDADRTRMEIRLREDGSAAWEIELWTRLRDDEERAAFDSLAEDVAADPGNYTTRFRDRMNDTVAAASDATGREMAVRNVTIDTRTEAIPEEYGVVTYTFVWEGFAVAEGGELRAGDAIDGLLMEEGTRLTMVWPAGYGEVSVDPDPTNRAERTVVWDGDDADFVRGQPRLVVSTDAGQGGLPVGPLALGAVALAAVAALAWLVRSGRIDLGGVAGGTGETEAGAAATGGDTDGGGDDREAPPSDLLSNEEQVLRLLEDNGGRIKQQQVVQELDWTEAKTSQVVTSMREEGEIEVFRIGRENVLALPDETEL